MKAPFIMEEGEPLPTKLIQWDDITQVFQPSELIVIAGRPSMGKTTFALNMIKHMNMCNKISCALFSIAMTRFQVVYRLGINANNTYLFIDDTPKLTILDFQSKARKMVTKHGVKVIFIDYLQLFRMPMNVNGLFETIADEQSYILCRLKLLSVELNVPIIVLSQLNRPIDGNEIRPVLAGFREMQSAIELCADKVCFIHRPEYFHLQGEAEFIVNDIRREESIIYQAENKVFKEITI